MKHFLRQRLHSFFYARDGLRDLFRTQANARIHLFAALVVLLAAWWLQLPMHDWGLLILAMALVMAAEAMNTAVEILCDLLHPEQHLQIKRVKDVAAASVLICALAAAVVGLLVFVPAIVSMLADSLPTLPEGIT